jgi:hypothetical protein
VRKVESAWRVCAAALCLSCTTAATAGPSSGDCCADLESIVERLEATTARKGNRSVKLQLAGVINQAVLGWDDGGERNAYVVTNDNSRSRFNFIGSAGVARGWQLGYRLEAGIRAANSKLVTQYGITDRFDGKLDIRESVWFLKSDTYGTLYVGTTFPSFTNIADANVTQTDAFDKYGGIENAGLSMFLRSANNGELSRTLTWRRIIGAGGDQPGETQRGFELVKYVSPNWNGFTAAATLVADDFWDATLRYKGKLGGFNIAAAGGYLDLVPGSRSTGVCALTLFLTATGDATKCSQAAGSISALHEDTGLFVNFGAGVTLQGLLQDTPRFAGTGVDDSEFFWAGQAGIERAFNTLGKTTFYGGVYVYDGGAPTGIPVFPGDPLNPTGLGTWSVWQSGLTAFGGGMAQGLDAAAMVLYLNYRHIEGSVTLRQFQGTVASGPIAAAPIDDLDLLLAGAMIRF